MIYITGDTHGDYSRFGSKRMKKLGIELTEEDYVIICGDFGLCWARDKTFAYDCDILAQKKCTFLWVQGNHENYDMIAEYPIEEWHGGKVRHIIRDKVILLERGQVFEIEGKTFFTFGGASSHDIQGGVLDREDPDFDEKRRNAIRRDLPYRVLHESWWPEELPGEAEMEEGRKNLEKVGYQVDYVITHCCADSIQKLLSKAAGHTFDSDILTDYLEELSQRLSYAHWYFGHYHENRSVDARHTLLYEAMVRYDTAECVNDVSILGRPKYRRGDCVSFAWGVNDLKEGTVFVVDANGTYEQNLEPSYDIWVEEDGCIYKHICESELLGIDEL